MFGSSPSAPKHPGSAPRAFGSPLPASLPRPMRLAFGAMLLAAFTTGPLYADPTFSVRIAPDPVASPIKVFVTVTPASGVAPRLEAGAFSVSVDGETQSPENFRLPPAEADEQKVSVVFAMDYSGSTADAQPQMEQAVKAFISEMRTGDYAGILKFNGSTAPEDWIIQEPILIQEPNLQLLSAVDFPLTGTGSPVLDAIDRALTQFTLLPDGIFGPRAIVLASDGGDNSSVIKGADVVKTATDNGIGIFAIGVGDTSQNLRARDTGETLDLTGEELMRALAGQTGGLYEEVTESTSIEDLYLQVSNLLANEYLLVFPFDVEECTTYKIEVSIDEYSFSETVEVSSRCPSSTGGVSSSSGGGGAFGPLGLIAGLSLLALRRRLVVA